MVNARISDGEIMGSSHILSGLLLSRTRPHTLTIGMIAALVALTGCAAESDSESPNPSASTTPQIADVDFLYQTRIGDGLGVFVNVGGQEVRVDEAAPGNRHKHPVWTNDGSQVAFVAEGEWDESGAVLRSSEVWTVGPDGGDAKAFITCTCWDLNNPAWSPDGARVAYAEFDAPAGDGPPVASRIVVLDVASGSRVEVAHSIPGQLIDIPRWSPDGLSLVISIDQFDDDGNETGSSFGVIGATGGELKPLLPLEEFAYAADWNWVSGKLVFDVETQDYASPVAHVSQWDLFEVDPDGTGRRAITSVGEDQQLSLPVWSSDGKLIAATLDATPGENGGQYAVVVDAASGAITQLQDPVSDYARIRPAG